MLTRVLGRAYFKISQKGEKEKQKRRKNRKEKKGLEISFTAS